jgi:hypothetical protein
MSSSSQRATQGTLFEALFLLGGLQMSEPFAEALRARGFAAPARDSLKLR